MCIDCQERPIAIKKRQLCSRCYNAFQKRHGPILTFETRVMANASTKREIEFIKNFFKGATSWLHHPAIFRFNGTSYEPDFYYTKQNVFIEVSGTRQAYHKNKDKYAAFRKAFPHIKFEIRQPSGELLNEGSRDKDWQQ